MRWPLLVDNLAEVLLLSAAVILQTARTRATAI